jgi:hypothetical protein
MDGSIRRLTGRHKAAQTILKWRDNVDDDDKDIHYFRLAASSVSLFTSCWGWLEGWNVLGITRCGVSRCGVSWGRVSWGFIGGSFVSSIRMVVFPVVLTISGVGISPLDLFELFKKKHKND